MDALNRDTTQGEARDGPSTPVFRRRRLDESRLRDEDSQTRRAELQQENDWLKRHLEHLEQMAEINKVFHLRIKKVQQDLQEALFDFRRAHRARVRPGQLDTSLSEEHLPDFAALGDDMVTAP